MTNPNDPANPVDITYGDGSRSVRVGLTKLEEFASRAMEALIANGHLDEDRVSRMAMRFAKALITELNEEQ